MRGLVHRQKQNTTLKMLQEKSINSSINGEFQKSLDSEQIEINRLLPSNLQQKGRKNNSKNQTSIFVVPTSKIQEKILANLLSNKQRNQENGKYDITRSQRSDTLPANFRSEFSNRKTMESKLSTLMKKQTHIKGNIQKIIGKEKANSELQYLHKRSECNLIENIQNLRRAERGFVSQDKNEDLEAQQRRNFIEQVLSQRLSEQMLSEYTKRKREIDLMKFKENIKNKLSRRHIYHTLKQKSEVWNKIRVKTHQHSPHTVQMHQEQNSLEKTNYPLHYGLTKYHFKKLRFNQLKETNLSFYESNDQLKVESKALALRVQGSRKIKQQNWTRNDQSVIESTPIKFKTLGGFNRSTNPQKEQPQGEKKRSQKYKVDCGFVRRDNSGPRTQEMNVFRQLTPWRGDYMD